MIIFGDFNFEHNFDHNLSIVVPGANDNDYDVDDIGDHLVRNGGYEGVGSVAACKMEIPTVHKV